MLNIAEILSDIQHTESIPRFHRISGIASLEELMNNMGHTSGIQLVVEDIYSGRFSDLQSQNMLNTRLYSFYVLKRAEITDPDDLELVRAECFEVVKKIISKLIHDRLTDHRLLSSHGLRNLDVLNIRYNSVGPVGDYFYGVQAYFNLLTPGGIEYNSADWEEQVS